MLPRRKERGETSPKILLNCWVGVVKIPLCSVGWGQGELKKKLNTVGGDSKSPIGMKNRDESGDPRIVHRKARWKS